MLNYNGEILLNVILQSELPNFACVRPIMKNYRQSSLADKYLRIILHIIHTNLYLRLMCARYETKTNFGCVTMRRNLCNTETNVTKLVKRYDINK